MKADPIRIVLDATVFRTGDWWLERREMRTFLDGSLRLGARIFIPEVVLKEAISGFCEALRARENAAKVAVEKWAGHSRTVLVSVPSETTEAAADRYRAHIMSTFGNNMVVLPIPAIPHVDLVHRDLERRKPFKATGKGYRDALIWASVLQLARDSSATIWFVTNNKSDFGAGPLVHAELSSDLAALGLPTEAVRLFPSLRDVNERLMKPFQVPAEKLAIPLLDWARSDLLTIVAAERWIRPLYGVAADHVELIKEEVQGYVIAAELEGTPQLLPSGDVLARGNALIFDLCFPLKASQQGYFDHEDVRQLFSPQRVDTDFSGATYYAPANAKISFSLMLKENSMEIIAVEVDSVAPVNISEPRHRVPLSKAAPVLAKRDN